MTETLIPEMSCQELVELVTAYLDGALPAADATRLEHHLEGCDGCRAYIDQMRQTIAALGHLPPESLTAEARERLMGAFAAWRDEGRGR
jgi:anti-sigma factor RsiW